MSILNDFESTAGGPVWNPIKKGKGADEVQFEVNDQSYLVGWYLGTKEGVGKHESKVHEFKIKQVGNEEHIQGEITDSGKVSVWGSGVLDSNIVENGIQIGQCVAIQYKGIPNGKKYHNWSILIPTDMSKYPPLSMDELSGVASPPPAPATPQTEEAPKAVPAIEAMDDTDDDDLPF